MGILVNLSRNMLRPRWGREMARKVWLRWSERHLSRQREECADWCRANARDAAAWAQAIDPALWEEAETFEREQEDVARRKRDELQMHVGGAGFYSLLYFLARLLKPQIIVETGVAFGFSSRAFLRALEENGDGRLISSDFPYFRLANPERLIGCLVEPELRRRWTLLVGSDRDNLPRIAASVGSIGLLHYDSDKSYSGRQFALDCLGPVLAPECLIIFDDIEDNPHFREWAEAEKGNYLVFECKGKWIGIRGGPSRLYPEEERSDVSNARAHPDSADASTTSA